jgi:hypothetical protein
MKRSDIILAELIEQNIFTIRGQKVMLDFHLARLYGVPTKSLNLAVKRNSSRFPEDFVFQLTTDEFGQVKAAMRFQFETSNTGRGGRRYLPYAFTEHGTIMAASVLNSPKAVEASIYVVRAFVKLRRFLASHAEIAHKLAELEQRIGTHDSHIQAIIKALRQLMAPPKKPRHKIGFRIEEPKAKYNIRRD